MFQASHIVATQMYVTSWYIEKQNYISLVVGSQFLTRLHGFMEYARIHLNTTCYSQEVSTWIVSCCYTCCSILDFLFRVTVIPVRYVDLL